MYIHVYIHTHKYLYSYIHTYYHTWSNHTADKGLSSSRRARSNKLSNSGPVPSPSACARAESMKPPIVIDKGNY